MSPGVYTNHKDDINTMQEGEFKSGRRKGGVGGGYHRNVQQLTRMR